MMISLTGLHPRTFSAHFFTSANRCPNYPSLVPMISTKNREPTSFQHLVYSNKKFLGFCSCSAVVFLRGRFCLGLAEKARFWETEGDAAGLEENVDLEAEVFDFMEKSAKPSVFPTKEELIAAGRVDLVEAIVIRGGWLAYGWDLGNESMVREDDELNGCSNSTVKDNCLFRDDDNRIFQERCDSSDAIDFADSEISSSSSIAASGRSIEMEVGESAGVEGILNGLERTRRLSFGFGSKGREGNGRVPRIDDDEDDWQGIPTHEVAGHERSSNSTSLTPSKDLFNDSGDALFQNGAFSDYDGIRSSPKPETWRTWSIRRAGFPETEFEAAEIVPNESGKGRSLDHSLFSDMDIGAESIDETRNRKKEPNSDNKEKFQNQIHSRLQRLELELTSILRLLRSRTDVVISLKDQGSSVEELHKLSDAWEFQETKLMKARDKLQSTRAKLAILEGKMAMEIRQAQKMVGEKQKKIDSAQRAVRLIRTASIVWPSSASEVFLCGSFDGWSSQRRMERSGAGIFSLNLRLYPGRYEIKFIVDGVWTVDPLRPVVRNNGYENNILIISLD